MVVYEEYKLGKIGKFYLLSAFALTMFSLFSSLLDGISLYYTMLGAVMVFIIYSAIFFLYYIIYAAVTKQR